MKKKKGTISVVVLLKNYPILLFILVGFGARFSNRFLFEMLGNVSDGEKCVATHDKLFKGVVNEF